MLLGGQAGEALRGKQSVIAGLDAVFVLSGSELAGSGGALLEHLLFGGIGIANLDGMLFSTGLCDRSIVEVLDDGLANVAALETSETNATTDTSGIAKDAAGANLVGSENCRQLVLIHFLGQVRHIEVRVRLVGELLQLRIEGLPSKADLVAQVMKSADAVLGIFVVVILDESKSIKVRKVGFIPKLHLPLAQLSLVVDDGLGALNIAKTLSPFVQHLISCFRQQPSNVYIGLPIVVLQAAVKWFDWGARCGNGPRNLRLLLHQDLKIHWDGARRLGLDHLRNDVRNPQLRRGRSSAMGVEGSRRTVDNRDAVVIVASERRTWSIVLIGRD